MSTKRKHSEETQETKSSNDPADDDQEFQDFLDSVDDLKPTDEAPAEDDGNNKNKDFEDFMGSVDNDEDAVAATADDTPLRENIGEDAAVDNDVTTTGVDGQKVEEVEQVAYEARLAKLMLLSRRKKGDIHMNGGNATDNTAREVGTGLVMDEEEETNEGDKSSEITEIKTLNKPPASSLLKDIMKKKQKKKRTSKEEDLDHDDTYWSNF